MRIASLVLASCLFIGGCCLNSVKDDQLMLTVPDALMEAPAKPKALTPEVETPKVAPWVLFG